MVKITVLDGVSKHTGSTVVGPVLGTVLIAQNFCKIEGLAIMTDDDTMQIPSHLYQLIPPLSHSHSFKPTASKVFMTIEGRPIIVKGDSYGSDATTIDSQGSNSFVEAI